MKSSWTNLTVATRLLVICATVLLVSAGLCGLQLLILSRGQSGNGNLAGFFVITGLIELAAMILSALICLVAFLLWLWTLVAKR